MSGKKVVQIYLTPEQHAKIKARSAELRKRSMGEYLWELSAQEMGICPKCGSRTNPSDFENGCDEIGR